MGRRNCLVVSMVLLMFVTGLATGCGAGGTAGRQQPKKLTIYHAVMDDYMQTAIKSFEKDTGIKVEAVRLSSGEVLARVLAEKDRPQASVWHGGPADSFIQAKEYGLLEKYVSPNAARISPRFKDADGYWTGIYVGFLGFASNKRLLAEKGLRAPASWQDLLRPELKGQVVVADPGSSGTAYTMLATVVQLMGEDKGLEYMKALDPQVKSYPKAGPAAAMMAGKGECAVAVTFLHDAIKYREEGMADLVLSAPAEGTGYEVGAVGIIKGGPDQEAARMWVDWCLTRKAQEMAQTVGSYQFLTNPEAQAPPQAEELKATRLIDYNLAWAGRNRTVLVEKWVNAVK